MAKKLTKDTKEPVRFTHPPCKEMHEGVWRVRLRGEEATTEESDEVMGVVMIDGSPMPDFGSQPGQGDGRYDFYVPITGVPRDTDSVEIEVFLGTGFPETDQWSGDWEDLAAC